jgi:hypothetical protein
VDASDKIRNEFQNSRAAAQADRGRHPPGIVQAKLLEHGGALLSLSRFHPFRLILVLLSSLLTHGARSTINFVIINQHGRDEPMASTHGPLLCFAPTDLTLTSYVTPHCVLCRSAYRIFSLSVAAARAVDHSF